MTANGGSTATGIRRPLLRWAGSKRSCAAKLGAFWRPYHERYIEPFCGSAAVFIALAPPKAILSDLNPELIGFYKSVKTNPKQVYDAFIRIPRNKSEYYRQREVAQTIDDPVQRSAVFLYLNRNCFNGLYRTNKSGAFNVPFSNYRVGDYPPFERFEQSCSAFEHAEFIHQDFEKVVVDNVCENDFVYLDPPYASSNARQFVEYGPEGFKARDIARLEKLLRLINEKNAHFLLSYGGEDEIKNIATQWKSFDMPVRRNISGFCSSRKIALDRVITNIRD